MNQHATVRGYVIGERQLCEVIQRPREQPTPHKSADANAARAFVTRKIIRFALRIVEFHPFGLHVDIAVRLLAVIDFRTSDLHLGRRRFNRHV